MSLTSTVTRVQYSGNSSTTVFPITFAFWDADDLLVINTVTATGVETEWTRGNQFTVTGGAGSTGSLTATTAPVTGTTLSIISDLPNTQPTSLPVGGQFPSATVEQQLDQIVRQVQQTNKLIDRALVQPDGDAADIARLPAKAARASQYLGFDSNGDPVGLAAPASTTAVSAFMATVLDDADAATARATLGAAALALAQSFTAAQTLKSTTAGASLETFLTLLRDHGAGAASDFLEALAFDGKNSSNAQKTFARIYAQIVTATAAAEDGIEVFQTIRAGTLADRAWLGAGLNVGTLALTDAGAGSVNISGSYKVNNVALVSGRTPGAQAVLNPYALNSTVTQAHGLSSKPTEVIWYLECLTAELGYSIGDRVIAGYWSDANAAGTGQFSIAVDATNTVITTNNGGTTPLLINKSTRALTALTAADWKLVATPYL